MLGEKIGDEIGHVTSTRVLPAEHGRPVMEVSFEADGMLLGEHTHDVGTYRAVLREDGTLFGEGQGVEMTESGASLLWRAQGIGQLTGRGQGAKWRGAIYYTTKSEKFARLMKSPCVFEYDVDETGKSESVTFEWK